MATKKLNGRLTICKTTSSNHGDYITIRLRDESSGCELIEVAVTKEEFTNALFSHADRPCVYEYHDHCPAGKRREVKTEVVFVPYDGYHYTAETVTKAVALFEVDGWQGRYRDVGNSNNVHKYTSDNDPEGRGAYYKVTFIRFMDVPE